MLFDRKSKIDSSIETCRQWTERVGRDRWGSSRVMTRQVNKVSGKLKSNQEKPSLQVDVGVCLQIMNVDGLRGVN